MFLRKAIYPLLSTGYDDTGYDRNIVDWTQSIKPNKYTFFTLRDEINLIVIFMTKTLVLH